MRREGFQIAVHGLQTVEWLFTAERRAGGFNRFSTVHTHESVQVLQWLAILFLRKQQQGLQATVIVGALGREDRLVEFHRPFRPGQGLIQIAASQRQHRFQFPDTQGIPAVVFTRRQAQQFTHASEIIVTFFVQLGDQVQIILFFPLAAWQSKQGFAQVRTHAVVRQPQIFSRVDVGHARHNDAACVNAQVFIVGNVDFLIFGVKDGH